MWKGSSCLFFDLEQTTNAIQSKEGASGQDKAIDGLKESITPLRPRRRISLEKDTVILWCFSPPSEVGEGKGASSSSPQAESGRAFIHTPVHISTALRGLYICSGHLGIPSLSLKKSSGQQRTAGMEAHVDWTLTYRETRSTLDTEAGLGENMERRGGHMEDGKRHYPRQRSYRWMFTVGKRSFWNRESIPRRTSALSQRQRPANSTDHQGQQLGTVKYDFLGPYHFLVTLPLALGEPESPAEKRNDASQWNREGTSCPSFPL